MFVNMYSGTVMLMDVPKIDEMLPTLQSSKFLISSKLRSGYCHGKLSLETRYKSAFTTIFWKYEFLKMIFGLAQVLAYSIALMQEVLGTFNDFCSFIWTIWKCMI